MTSGQDLQLVDPKGPIASFALTEFKVLKVLQAKNPVPSNPFSSLNGA